MGLDLIISVQSDFDKDKRGRNVYKVTQLANLKNCWMILNFLSNRLDNFFDNCTTYTFYGETFHEVSKELQEELEESLEDKEEPEYTERRMSTIKYNIKKLKEFITANNVPNNDTQDYQVHVWW